MRAPAPQSTRPRRDRDLSIGTDRPDRIATVRGMVVMGDQRGRTLGFPTANVLCRPRTDLPPDGVYAGDWVWPDGTTTRAAISIGGRPTFYERGERLVEAHLIDFDGDLYGQPAVLHLDRYLRAQQRFDGVDALIAQLRVDVCAARYS